MNLLLYHLIFYSKKNITLFCIFIIYLVTFYLCDSWNHAAFEGDSFGYYAHLPATFIHSDVGDYSKTFAAVKNYPEGRNIADPKIDKYGIRPTPSGKYAIKYSHGMALLWLPFFTIAHLFCKITQLYPTDGFSKPYMLLVGLSMIFYIIIGLNFLWKILFRYFDEKITLLTIIAIALATNLLYFTVYNNLMSHAILFAIYCGLIYATDSFFRSPSKRWASLVAACVAMIILIRMNELYCILIPLFWDFVPKNMTSIIERFKICFKYFLLPFTFFIFGLMSIQFFYWKYVANQWLYYAYVGETFDFKHPHIIDGLFSFENGWLVWTPIMTFALLGLFWLRRFAKAISTPIFIIIPLHIYIIYSWWCFTYINGMGSRPMVEMYALLAFPLATISAIEPTNRLFRNIKNAALILLITFFTWLNFFQTYQQQQGLMVSSECKREFYKEMFGRSYSAHSSLVANMCNEHDAPSSAIKISDLYKNNFEDSTPVKYTSSPVSSGKYCYKMTTVYDLTTSINIGKNNIKKGDFIKVSVKGFFYEKDRESTRWLVPMIVCTFKKPDGKDIKNRPLHISSFIGNKDFNFWHTGSAEEWGEAYFYVKVPKNIEETDDVNVYIWSPSNRLIFIDDMKIELWR